MNKETLLRAHINRHSRLRYTVLNLALAKQTQPETDLVILLEDQLLVLLPVNATVGMRLSSLLTFCEDFFLFPPRDKQWSWNAKLALQLSFLLECLEQGSRDDFAGEAYIYLNGNFQKKYYPVAHQNQSAQPNHACLGIVGEDCRNVNPNLTHILNALGPHSLQNAELSLSPDQESYFRYNRQLDILGIGRGASEQKMSQGAMFEFTERWIAHLDPEDKLTAAYQDIAQDALRPDQIWGISPLQASSEFLGFRADLVIDWLPAMMGDQRKYIPLEMVNYLLDSKTSITNSSNSSGCALGNSPAEANLFSAMEIVERDALLTTWYSRSSPPRFTLNTVTCPRSLAIFKLFDLWGYELACFDMSLEWNVPSVLVVLAGRSEQQIACFVTSAAHLNPKIALHSALEEAKSLILTSERNYQRLCQQEQTPGDSDRLGPHQEQYLYYCNPKNRHHFDFLLNTPESLSYQAFLEKHPFQAATAIDLLAQVQRAFRQKGSELIMCDNTPPALRDCGLYSARSYLPNSIHLTFGARAPSIPEQRFHQAARHVDWMRAIDVPAQLQVHPLG